MNTLFYIWWLLATIADLFFTKAALDAGFHEAAPIMRWAIDKYGLMNALLANLAISILVGIPASHNKRIIIAIAGVRSLIAAWNFYIWWRAK